MLVQARVERDETGTATRLYGFIQDITEEKRISEEIQRINVRLEERVHRRTAELEDARKELSAFSYAVSHDLRQPLRAIAGYLTIFAEEAGATLTADVQDFLDHMQVSVRRMDSIIDALLALSRLSRAPLHREDVDATTMAREIAAELDLVEAGRRVEWHIQQDLTVDADSGLLRVILQNLMANAFKFTRGREPARIDVGRRCEAGGDVFFVHDNGAGFEAATSRRLFQPFQRMHTAEEFEGTGIGLATVARVVQRHGGWIRAESKPDEGATFLFTLSASGRAAAPAAAAAAA